MTGAWSPYEELGVLQSATLEEIKASFRELARRHHPDKEGIEGTGDSGEKFKRVREAYEILCDAEARAKFDAGELKIRSLSGGTVAEVDLGYEPVKHFLRRVLYEEAQ